MPCQGPVRSQEREDVVFQDVLGYLQEKHGLLNTPLELVVFPKLQESRKEAIRRLREAVGEIVWQDDCEGF